MNTKFKQKTLFSHWPHLFNTQKVYRVRVFEAICACAHGLCAFVYCVFMREDGIIINVSESWLCCVMERLILPAYIRCGNSVENLYIFLSYSPYYTFFFGFGAVGVVVANHATKLQMPTGCLNKFLFINKKKKGKNEPNSDRERESESVNYIPFFIFWCMNE